MNFKSILSNLSVAIVAQGVSVVLSIVSSLLVPKILGVEEYGYWQLFLYYISYVGFFHLGLNDGVYLIFGGTPRDKIDKRTINSQFWFGFAFQAVFAAVIVIVASTGAFGADRGFVLFWTAVFIVLQNLMSYLGYVFQAMNETKLFSYTTIVERLSFLVPLVMLLIIRDTSYKPYVYAYFFSCSVGLVYCIYYARDFFSAGLLPVGDAVREGLGSVRVGIKLTLANTASTLILGATRSIVDMVWGISAFGQLSFSISIVNFILNFIMQVSMVLFPALRQGNEEELKSFFVNSRDITDLLLPAFYILYFPVVWILGLWLPQYLESFQFFAYLIPVCVFDGKMNVISTTIFKVKRKETLLLVINFVTVGVSALGSFIGAYLLHSAIFAIISAVIAIVGRSSFSELYIARMLGTDRGRALPFEICLTAAFVFLCVQFSAPVAAGIYVVLYGLYAFAFRGRYQELLGKTHGLFQS